MYVSVCVCVCVCMHAYMCVCMAAERDKHALDLPGRGARAEGELAGEVRVGVHPAVELVDEAGDGGGRRGEALGRTHERADLRGGVHTNLCLHLPTRVHV